MSNWYLNAKASKEIEAEIDPNVGTNFSNWFNSSAKNGFGSLDHLNKDKKKRKKSPYKYVNDPDAKDVEPTEDYD